MWHNSIHSIVSNLEFSMKMIDLQIEARKEKMKKVKKAYDEGIIGRKELQICLHNGDLTIAEVIEILTK